MEASTIKQKVKVVYVEDSDGSDLEENVSVVSDDAVAVDLSKQKSTIVNKESTDSISKKLKDIDPWASRVSDNENDDCRAESLIISGNKGDLRDPNNLGSIQGKDMMDKVTLSRSMLDGPSQSINKSSQYFCSDRKPNVANKSKLEPLISDISSANSGSRTSNIKSVHQKNPISTSQNNDQSQHNHISYPDYPSFAMTGQQTQTMIKPNFVTNQQQNVCHNMTNYSYNADSHQPMNLHIESIAQPDQPYFGLQTQNANYNIPDIPNYNIQREQLNQTVAPASYIDQPLTSYAIQNLHNNCLQGYINQQYRT